MRDLVLRNLARPLIERLGTMLAAYLIARGLDSDAVATAINALLAFLFVLLDLVVASFNRERDIAQARGLSLGYEDPEGR